MAVTLQLVCDALTTLDLNSATSAGFRVMAWNQAIATPVYGGDPPPVSETMDLILESTSHDDLASDMQDLHAYAVQADAYMRDRTMQAPVWLRCKMNNETGTRQALVMRIDGDFRDGLYAVGCAPGDNKARLRIRITRGPYWEVLSGAAVDFVTGAQPAAAASVIVDYAATNIVGDIPARITTLSVWPNADGDQFGRLWMGARSSAKAGTPANFQAVWECEDGTNATDAADGADATASDGNRVRITPGTATWAERMSITLEEANAAGNYADNLGRFLWLLRTKVSAGTWEVQLRFGYGEFADDDYVRGPVVEVAGTSWDFKEMGTSTMPLRNYHVLPTGDWAVAMERYNSIQIWARRTSGAGTLDLDCLCPIPVDEWFLSMDGFTASRTDIDNYETALYAEAPEASQQAMVYELDSGINTYWTHIPTVIGKLRIPPGDGRLIMVYARAATSDITDTVAVSISGLYRWLSLRGNDIWTT